MRCNPCDGTGFKNTHQLDDLIPGWPDLDAYDLLQAVRGLTEPHDVAPGEHYNAADPEGGGTAPTPTTAGCASAIERAATPQRGEPP